MLRPSGAYTGSVSMPEDWVRRRGSPPLASMVYSCEPPSRLAEFAGSLDATRAAANLLEPYYHEMVLRAASTDVGMQRWAGAHP